MNIILSKHILLLGEVNKAKAESYVVLVIGWHSQDGQGE